MTLLQRSFWAGVALGLALIVTVTKAKAEVSPDGKLEVVLAGDTVKLIDKASGKEIRAFKGHVGAATAATFSPDGKRLATGGNDKTVCMWDMATGKLLFKFRGNEGVVDLRFAPDGKTLTVTDQGKNKISLDAATGKRLQ
jgi:WD40 repeat protein